MAGSSKAVRQHTKYVTHQDKEEEREDKGRKFLRFGPYAFIDGIENKFVG